MEHTQDQPAVDLVGTVLGERYRIERRLGQGGMGVVYRARHVVLDSALAVKVLLAPQNAEDQQRFLQEAKLASVIKHPNTVQIVDFGVLPSGQTYLVMELMSGRTLADELEKGPLDVLRACRIGAQIARGLHAVHAQGIVHRDIKPDNVFLLNQDGTTDFVKIVDFGIAKTVGASEGPALQVRAADPPAPPDPYAATGRYVPPPPPADALLPTDKQGLSQTRNSLILGTPPYMSPEQCRSTPVDGRSDQYSLGCMLYEMLVGQWVFSSRPPLEMMFAHLSLEPEPLRVRAPRLKVPEALEQTVMRLLAKQPEDRFASMQEVADILGNIAELLMIERGEKMPTGSLPITRVSATHLTLGRHRIPLRLAALAVLGVLFVALGSASFFGYRLYKTAQQPTLEPGELQAVKAQALTGLRQLAKTAGEPGELALRLDAITALGQTQDTTLGPELTTLLGDPLEPVQAEAAAALGRLGDRAAVPSLRAALGKAPGSLLRLAAARALVDLGDPQGAELLGQALGQGTPEQRLRAASLLCDRRNAAAEKLLLQVIEQGLLQDESAVLGALGCLLTSQSAEAARAQLRRRLQAASTPQQQIKVAQVLARVGDAEGRRVLRELAEHPGLPQLPAARALAAPDVPDVAELFRGILRDRQAADTARLLASEGLGNSGRLLDVRLLGRFLTADKASPALREAAAVAVLRLGAADPTTLGAESLSWARGSLGSGDWRLRESAALVLGESTAPEAVALLSGLLRDQDPRVRRGLARALGRHTEEPALLALQAALHDSDAEVRLETLRSLGRISQYLVKHGARGVLGRVKSWLGEILASGAVREQILARTDLLQLGDDSQKAALWALPHAADPALRRFLLEEAPFAAEPAAALLKDPDPGVRFAAAQKLAEAGDPRAITVLNQALQQGGTDVIAAYGLLTKLGQTAGPPAALQTALNADRPVIERMAAIESFAHLPAALAVPLLLTAARDGEPLVRRLSAEVAAELKGSAARAELPGFPVLRFLLDDPDPAVKNRAAALLARVALPSAPPPKPADPAASPPAAAPVRPAPRPDPDAEPEPEPAPADSPEDPAQPDATAAKGTLLVDAPDGALIQVDGGKWQIVTSKGVALLPGAHHITTLGGDYDVTIETAKKAHLQLAASPVDEAVQAGARAYQHQEYGKAQTQYDRASTLCNRDRPHKKACAALDITLALERGRIFEKQKRLSAAMNQYQKALDGASGKVRVQAAESMSQLAPLLSKITLHILVKGKCQDRVQWLSPGKKQKVKVGDQSVSVSVRAGQSAEAGTCP